MDERWNIPLEINERVQFDSSLGGSKLSPWKQREAEFDGRGIESISYALEFQRKLMVIDMKLPCLGNERVGKFLVNSVIPGFVGFLEGGAFRYGSQPQVIELLLMCRKAYAKVSQALALAELTKYHGKKLLPTSECFYPMIPLEFGYALLELILRKKADNLIKDIFTLMHAIVGQE